MIGGPPKQSVPAQSSDFFFLSLTFKTEILADGRLLLGVDEAHDGVDVVARLSFGGFEPRPEKPKRPHKGLLVISRGCEAS